LIHLGNLRVDPANQIRQPGIFGLADLHLILKAANIWQLFQNAGKLSGIHFTFNSPKTVSLLQAILQALGILFDHQDNFVFKLREPGIKLGLTADLNLRISQLFFEVFNPLLTPRYFLMLNLKLLFHFRQLAVRFATFFIDPAKVASYLGYFLGQRCV
jgi:hypothetical protein